VPRTTAWPWRRRRPTGRLDGIAFVHYMKISGPHGAGKTLPACALPSILRLASDEASEIT